MTRASIEKGFGTLPPKRVSSTSRGQAYIDRLAESESPAFTARRARREERSGLSQDPIVWARARGCNVEDVDGNRYVDLTSGFGVAALGHAHPEIVRAIGEQSEVLIHGLGDYHPSDKKIELLERLVAMGPWEEGARAVLSLSGADAITTALKTAALKTGKPGVICFSRGYHGLSYGPLAACAYAPSFKAPFLEQLNPHIVECALPGSLADLNAIETAIRDDIGAVLIEPVQARGGVHIVPPEVLRGLAEICRRRGALLIADEIFTGLGRTGKLFASAEAKPDLLCIGKALGAGMPISACIGRAEVMGAWGQPDQIPMHTGTFFGHPLSCAAALRSLQLLEENDLIARAKELGSRFEKALSGFDMRRSGALIGVVANDRALRIVSALLDAGYLTLPAGPDASVVQIVPPLTMPFELIDGFAETLRQVWHA